jgi:hypothetical protein
MSTSQSLPQKNSSSAGGAEASFENTCEDIMAENGPVALSPTQQIDLAVDVEQAIAQLSALGYNPGDTVFFRKFPPKGVKGYPQKFSYVFPNIPKLQSPDGGLYFVVNGGGQKNKDVVAGKAIFFEHDDRPIEDQVFVWQEKGLPEPTLQVQTRKSCHTHYAIRGGCSPDEWSELQKDLLEFVDGDRKLKDLSRVMRLAGAWHIKADEPPVRCDIIHQSGQSYTYEELRAIVPPRSKPVKVEAAAQPVATEPLTIGEVDTSLSDLLHQQILPRLSPEQIFNWPGHDWQPDHSGTKYRGCCPWHESQSGTAFFIDRKDGVWLWNCPGCNYIGGGAIEYRHRLKGGDGKPRKRDFVDLVKELAAEAGVPMPEYRPAQQQQQQQTVVSDSSGIGRNKWYAPEAWQGEIGYWVVEPEIDGFRTFNPKCNFDFEVERELSGLDGDCGLVLQVKRSLSKAEPQKRVAIRSLDRLSPKDFIAALTRVFGLDVVCNLKQEQLQALIHVKLCAYHDRGGKVYRLVDRVGQQEDGTWVFEDIQFTKDGEVTDEETSLWVYNPNLGGEDKIPSPKVVPPDAQALPRLVAAMRRFHGEVSILPALFSMGWSAACFHYQTIMKREKWFPLLNLIGDPGSGKTVAGENGLSLAGWRQNDGVLHRVSTSASYERMKCTGSLPLLLDDPERSRELDELLKGFFNGVPRQVRGNFQEPHTSVQVASNHACGDDHAATLSRLIQVPFFKNESGDRAAWDEMQAAMKQASGALPQLIKLGYPAEEIRALASELREHLPHAHGRVADSMALIGWYALAVCRLGGYPEMLMKTYIINTLCKAANDADSAADSLQDFLSKLHALKSQSKIGDWDIRKVETAGGTSIAIHMSSVWTVFDRTFRPPYSKRIIESLVDKAGGKTRTTQRFHRTEDESKTYYRMKLTYTEVLDGDGKVMNPPPREPDLVPKKAIVLPPEMAIDFLLQETEVSTQTIEPCNQVTACNHDVTRKWLPTEPLLQKASSVFYESCNQNQKEVDEVFFEGVADVASEDEEAIALKKETCNAQPSENLVTCAAEQPSTADTASVPSVTKTWLQDGYSGYSGYDKEVSAGDRVRYIGQADSGLNRLTEGKVLTVAAIQDGIAHLDYPGWHILQKCFVADLEVIA